MDDKIDMELFERAVLKRSLALRADCHYLFNIVPTLELVRKAFSMGFDVVPLSDETRTRIPSVSAGGLEVRVTAPSATVVEPCDFAGG
jgi:hypothetical protein